MTRRCSRASPRPSPPPKPIAQHTEVQAWLRDLGRALGYEVWIAANDRSKRWELGRLGDGCLTALPGILDESPFADTVQLIDVLWLEPGQARVAAAFEVDREADVRVQRRRPAFSRIASLQVKYLPYDALEQHGDAIAKFGTGLKGIDAIARPV